MGEGQGDVEGRGEGGRKGCHEGHVLSPVCNTVPAGLGEGQVAVEGEEDR